jgi:holliday junction DNA helicase RuvA
MLPWKTIVVSCANFTNSVKFAPKKKMFAYFDGKLSSITPAYAIIDCNGVGYLLHISLHTFSQIKDKEHCRLYAHLSIKEDAHQIFGFADDYERQVFRSLISVSGVGSNTARLILSSLSPNEITQAIAGENTSLLQSVKGIGAKSAQRIIVDLKDKIQKDVSQGEIIPGSRNTTRQEALSALIMLGFSKMQAEKAVDKAIQAHGNMLSVEELIKETLKYF